jgi:hypothetical protein
VLVLSPICSDLSMFYIFIWFFCYRFSKVLSALRTVEVYKLPLTIFLFKQRETFSCTWTLLVHENWVLRLQWNSSKTLNFVYSSVLWLCFFSLNLEKIIIFGIKFGPRPSVFSICQMRRAFVNTIIARTVLFKGERAPW